MEAQSWSPLGKGVNAGAVMWSFKKAHMTCLVSATRYVARSRAGQSKAIYAKSMLSQINLIVEMRTSGDVPPI